MWDISNLNVKKSKTDSDYEESYSNLPYLGTLELPVKINMCVRLIPCGDSPYLFRVIVISDEGNVLIIEIEGTRGRRGSNFRVVSDIQYNTLFGDKLLHSIDPTVVDGTISSKNKSLLSTSKSFLNSSKLSISNLNQTTPRCVSDKNMKYVTFLGVDGAVRIFDPSTILGIDSTTMVTKRAGAGAEHRHKKGLVGNQLRTRAPHGYVESADSINEPLDNESSFQKEPIKKDTVKPLSSSNSQNVKSKRNEMYDSNSSQKADDNEKTSKVKSLGNEKKTDNNLPTKAAAADKDINIAKRILKSGQTANIPLFELASLSPSESRVTTMKLRSFLSKNGEFPNK
jgi:hypothetical protein